MPRIELTEVERLALAKAGAQSIPCNNGWRPWSTVPENTWVLVSFYWKNSKRHKKGIKWDISIGRTKDRNGTLIEIDNVAEEDFEDFVFVWQPLPQPPQDELK